MENKAKAEVLLLIGALKGILESPPNLVYVYQLVSIQRKMESWAYEHLVNTDSSGIFNLIPSALES